MTAKPHTCYAVFDADDRPLWYTVRPEKGDSVAVYTSATNRNWSRCEDVGYTVRKLRMTEAK